MRVEAARPPKSLSRGHTLPFPEGRTMTLELPKPVVAYFTADRADSEGLSRCFTENAVVKDEGHTYAGRAAIRKWKADASAKYRYTSEPFACEQKEGKKAAATR